MKLRGILIHGAGIGLSAGLDVLASKINVIDDVHVDFVEEGAFAYELLGRNQSILEQCLKTGSHLLYGGHSMGADEVWKMSMMLQGILIDKKIRTPFVFSYDPTCWGVNGGAPGEWRVPSMIDVAANWRQPWPPGGGHIVPYPGNTTTAIHEFDRVDPHVGIETTADTHQWIVEHIIAALAKL